MVVGFNHNFRYRDVLYHIQTEDGGIRNPVIITHLFDGGTILATKKTSYADIVKADSLEQVVEELMKEQHREMLRRLRKGEFDALIDRLAGKSSAAPRATDAVPAAAVTSGSAAPLPAEPVSPPKPAAASVAPQSSAAVPPASAQASAAPTPSRPPSPPIAAPLPAPPTADLADRVLEKSLDDIILSYLLGEDK